MSASFKQERASIAATGSRDFSRMIRLLMLAKGDRRVAANIEADKQNSYIANVFEKAEPGSLGGSSPSAWAGALADFRVIAGAFLASLRNVGIFDTALPFTKRMPFRSRIVVSTLSVVGSDIAEADSKLVSELNLDASELDFRKAAALTVIGAELLRFTTAEALIETELRNAVIAAVDRDFLNLLIAGTTPTASSGDALIDLGVLLDAVEMGSDAAPFFVVPVAAAKQLAVYPAIGGAGGGLAYPQMGALGGKIGGIPVLATSAFETTAVLFDAAQLAVAAEGISVDASQHANIVMSNGESPEVVLNLFQDNLRAVRVERYWAAKILNASAVASLTGVSYSPGSP